MTYRLLSGAAGRRERVEGAEDRPDAQVPGQGGDLLGFLPHDVPVDPAPVGLGEGPRPGRRHDVLARVGSGPFGELGQPCSGGGSVAHELPDLRAALAQGPRVGGVFRDGGLGDRETQGRGYAGGGLARGGRSRGNGVMRCHHLVTPGFPALWTEPG